MKKLDPYSLIVLLFIFFYSIQAKKLCILNDVSGDTGCTEFETCTQVNVTSDHGICDCKTDYQRSPINNTCIYINPEESALKSDDETTSSPNMDANSDPSNTLTIIVLTLLIFIFAFVIVFGTYIAERKYRFITKIRSQLYNRTTTNYDDVMIGQDDDDDDDPPLA
ncbi:uncharacterized protein LOC123300001 [Chrysoperla carnea]|uniref:uncharacterized protein LOC123300001 n=1 Tax=Chrysoperla carnea TaxID=189513 RepID=UPI001D0839F3|nr:uncharacterized protein LOC123300001 [Chrysoperla carnea]